MNGKIPKEVSRQLESTTGDRYKCPFCDARRGVSWDPEQGDTGVLYCFSCRIGLSGIQCLAKMWFGSPTDENVGKALQRLDADLDTDEIDSAIRRAERNHEPDRSEAQKRLLRVERARERMTPVETSLYDALVSESRCTPHEEESDRLREDIATLVSTALSRQHFLDGID